MVFVPLIPTGFIELGKKDYEGGGGGAFCRWQVASRSVPRCSRIKQSLNAQFPLTQYVWCELLNHVQAMSAPSIKLNVKAPKRRELC